MTWSDGDCKSLSADRQAYTQNFEIANLEEHPEQRGTSGTAFRFEGLLTVRRMKFSTMIVSN
jgi:hypothetical protein